MRFNRSIAIPGSRYLNYGKPVNWASPLNRDLVSWWLNLPQRGKGNTFFDVAGTNHGTLTNAPTWQGASGRPGGFGAVNIDSTDDYVDFLSLANVFGGKAAASICFWWMPGTLASNDFLIDCGGFDFKLYCVASPFNRLTLDLRDGVSGGLLGVLETGNDAYVEGQWCHVAISVTNGDQRLLVNGIQKASNTATFVTFDVDGDNYFRLGHASTPAAGLYDDLRLYFTTRTNNQFNSIYQDSLQGYQQTMSWNYRPLVYADTGGGGGATGVGNLCLLGVGA